MSEAAGGVAVGVGVFGKIPAHGDFVSMGTASATGRAFERFGYALPGEGSAQAGLFGDEG